MHRANAVSLVLAAALVVGTGAYASDAAWASDSISRQPTAGNGAPQSQPDAAMDMALLVFVDARGQVRSIQHSTRLPTKVNDLLWRSVRQWVKTSPVINGRHRGAQVLMNVTLHAQPQAGDQTSVHFTLASVGPLMRGYWFLQGDHLYGYCAASSSMDAGDGGRGFPCFSKLTPASTAATPAPVARPTPATGLL